MLKLVLRYLLVFACVILLVVFAQRVLARDQYQEVAAAEKMMAGADAPEPTRQVTVADVLTAKIPPPTLTRVSTPGMNYRKAFPEDKTTRDEEIHVIRSYDVHPSNVS